MAVENKASNMIFKDKSRGNYRRTYFATKPLAAINDHNYKGVYSRAVQPS